MRLCRAAVVALVCAAPAGCGGGGGDEPRTATEGTAPPVGQPIPGGKEVRGTGYALSAARGWTPGDGGRVDLILLRREPSNASAPFPTNLSVGATPVSEGATATDGRSTFVRQAQAMGGQEIEQLPDRSVDGEPAVVLRYLRNTPTGTLRQELVAVVHERRLYSIALSAAAQRFAGARAEYARMLASWRWT